MKAKVIGAYIILSFSQRLVAFSSMLRCFCFVLFMRKVRVWAGGTSLGRKEDF